MTEPNTFAGATLDRAAEHRRDPGWVAAAAADPRARAVLVGDDGVHVAAAGGAAGLDDGWSEPATAAATRLALVPLAALRAAGGLVGGAEPSEPVLLGLDAAGPVFAVDADGAARDGAPPPHIAALGEGPVRADTGTRPVGLRVAAASLPQADAGLAAHASALINWHRRHRHCSVCGSPTTVAEGGIVRRCPHCGAEHHPRTDPVVIMLVVDGDRALLGRQRAWPAGRYSALAGFVEPGESLEAAVAREVREEAAVEIGPPRYVASQPWPFPSSLMLGFEAEWRSGEPRRADDELEDVRWFERAEIAAAVAGDETALGLPPRFAIARRLIERWLAPDS